MVEGAELAAKLELMLLLGNVAALGQCWQSCSRNAGPACHWEVSWLSWMRTPGWVALSVSKETPTMWQNLSTLVDWKETSSW